MDDPDGGALRAVCAERPTGARPRRDRRFLQVLFLYMWFGGLLGTWFELGLRAVLGLASGDHRWYSPLHLADFFEFQEPYALGAAVVVLVVIPLKERFGLGPEVVFVLTAALSGGVELLSALALVLTLGHNPFWDYSDHPYSLHGYTSVLSVAVFGLLAMLFIYVVHPATRPALDQLGRRRMALVVTMAAILYLTSTVAKLARYGWIF